MIDNYFRAALARVATPYVTGYQKFGLTPNHISLLALGIAVIAAVLTGIGWTWLAVMVWWLGRLLDGTDGIYARRTGQASHFGAYLDFVCDMGAYSVMIIGFYYLFPDYAFRWVFMLGLYVMCSTSALSLGMLEKEVGVLPRDNRGLRLASGLAEGGETGIAYTLFLLLPEYINALTLIWLTILLLTIVLRTFLAAKVLKARPIE